MSAINKLSRALFYRDLFCPKCHLVAERLYRVQVELGLNFSWRVRAFPSNSIPWHLGNEGVLAALREQRRLKDEIDSPLMVDTFWKNAQKESIRAMTMTMAMAAVEVAYFQNRRLGRSLDRVLRRSLFEQGKDIRQLKLVLAAAKSLCSEGLDIDHFKRDLFLPGELAWQERILDGRNYAGSQKVRDAPALVVGDVIIEGVRTVQEYLVELADLLALDAGKDSSAAQA